jgi:hypothetical protein
MGEALSFLQTYEAIIYLVLGALALWEIRKFSLAWDEVRGAAFGLERESAQVRLNQAAIWLVLILTAGIGEFIVVSFVAPTIPEANLLATPTIDLLATPTSTLPVSTPGPTAEGEVASTTPQPVVPEGSGCILDQLMIAEPAHGSQVSGEVTLVGTADMPNFGFYRYEIANPDDPVWLTIQAGRQVKKNEELGKWDTRSLTPGPYKLRLVVSDNEGNELGKCEISVDVVAETP